MTNTSDHDGIRLTMLGGFELTIDGTPAVLQPAAQRLLAFVALATRGVDRSFAALQLWPDKQEERAKANLRSTLWRLGKIPAQLIDARKTRLHLDSDVWVDTHDGIAELATTQDSPFLDGCLPFQSLDSALLPDWYDDWLVIERERFRQLHLGVLEDRARRALSEGRCSQAIQLALAAASVDPLRESPHRIVIEAHLAESNDSEAVAHFDRYRQLLATDPCLCPSRDMTTLVAPLKRPALAAG
ncbi:MAG: transcriptional regulator [Acidimicrobiia bacterium]|nr:transcriptional regulator [Acidimicrobiia bacterium]